MNYPTAASEALVPGVAGSPLSVHSVARFVAGSLSGLHRVNGQFVQVTAAVERWLYRGEHHWSRLHR
jgi:hypothetical protein